MNVRLDRSCIAGKQRVNLAERSQLPKGLCATDHEINASLVCLSGHYAASLIG